MRKLRSPLLILAGAALFSGTALACPSGDMPMHGDMMKHGMNMGHEMGGQHGGRGHYDQMMEMHALDALNLDAEQRKKVTALRRELRNDTWDLQRQEIDAREQLGELYGSGKMDVAAIKATYEKLFQVKLKMIEHTLNFKQALIKILTKEQMEQFQQMMHGPRGGHHGGRMDHDAT